MTRTILLSLGLALAAAGPALADDTVRPGDYHRAIDDGWCTLNFVYDGVGDDAGRTFFGSAAHCVVLGAEVTLASGTAPTDMANATKGELLGRVVATGADTDWALVEVRPEMAHRVQAGLRGHPEWPTGVADPAGLAAGDLLQHEGWGAGAAGAPQTREGRQGVLKAVTASDWQGVSPIMGGDSAGPVIHVASGGAVGSLQGYYCATLPDPDCGMSGPLVRTAIAGAAKAGIDVKLRAVGDVPPVAAAPSPSGPPATEPPSEPSARPAPSGASSAPACSAPTLDPARSRLSRRRVDLRGARGGCAGAVEVSVQRGCAALTARGRLRRGPCSRRIWLRTSGAWRLRLPARLPRGRYVITVRALGGAATGPVRVTVR